MRMASRPKHTDSTTLCRPPGRKMQIVQHFGGFQGFKSRQYTTLKGCKAQKGRQYNALEASRATNAYSTSLWRPPGPKMQTVQHFGGLQGQKCIQCINLDASRPKYVDITTLWKPPGLEMHTVQHFEGLQGPKTQTVQRFGGLQGPKWIQYNTLEPSRANREDSTTL